MDSTEIPVYGEQEHSAYNGHFESTCYHTVASVQWRRAIVWRPSSVLAMSTARRDGEEFLLPEIERQQLMGKEVAFRADAAFAKPEVYEALEERGVKYAIRIAANENLRRDIGRVAATPGGKARQETAGRVQGVLVPSRKLEDSPTGGLRR